MKIFVDDWPVTEGAHYSVNDDVLTSAPAVLVEDGSELKPHGGPGGELLEGPVAFVDGVRRGEALLYQENDVGDVAAGVAGAYACGAVLVSWKDPPEFIETRATRVVLWESRRPSDLPEIDGGFRWKSYACESKPPLGPLDDLQRRMREEEGRLAGSLCDKLITTIVDGTLRYVIRRDRPVVGYIKTHHSVWLDRDNHRLVPGLRVGERTSLFRIGDHRYSAYLRIAAQGAYSGPWSGIVRIEIPRFAPLCEVARLADQVASAMPRFAGVPHRDPRAPQNLQPIGALEAHLRHLLGDQGLAARAVRDAVAKLGSERI
jgi:hypothetical protein